MVKDGDDERRTSPRIRLRRNVSVSLRGGAVETHTINVSSGGASIELGPGGISIQAEGEVTVNGAIIKLNC